MPSAPLNTSKRIISSRRSTAKTWPVSFRLEKEQLDELKLEARLTHRSVSGFVKEAVARLIADGHRVPAPPAVPPLAAGAYVVHLGELSYAYHAMALSRKRFAEAESVEELVDANALHWDAQRIIADTPKTPPLRALIRALRAADRKMHLAARFGGVHLDAAALTLARARDLLSKHRVQCS